MQVAELRALAIFDGLADEQLGELNKLLSRGMSGLMHVEAVTVR